MLDIRDGIDAERFSSTMVVEGQGEGEGTKKPKKAKKPFDELAPRPNDNFERSSLRQNPAPLPRRAPSAECRESVTYYKLCKQSGLLFTRSAIQLKAKRARFFA